MSASRTSRAMRTWYAIFLGLMVALVLGLLTVVLAPEAAYDATSTSGYDEDAQTAMLLRRMLVSLASSVAVLALGLYLARRADVLASGLVLGALFNLLLGSFWGWGYQDDTVRLLVAVVSLALTALVGWWHFLRGAEGGVGTAAGAPAPARRLGAGGDELVFGPPEPQVAAAADLSVAWAAPPVAERSDGQVAASGAVGERRAGAGAAPVPSDPAELERRLSRIERGLAAVAEALAPDHDGRRRSSD